MTIWNRLFKRRRRDLRPQRLDYLNEALALERQGDFDAALTSYRLALRDHPADIRVLQNIWRDWQIFQSGEPFVLSQSMLSD